MHKNLVRGRRNPKIRDSMISFKETYLHPYIYKTFLTYIFREECSLNNITRLLIYHYIINQYANSARDYNKTFPNNSRKQVYLTSLS